VSSVRWALESEELSRSELVVSDEEVLLSEGDELALQEDGLLAGRGEGQDYQLAGYPGTASQRSEKEEGTVPSE
jgi:hypothetical protein